MRVKYRSPVEWEVGAVGLGPSDDVPALGVGWMRTQGFAVWLWRWVLSVGPWSRAMSDREKLLTLLHGFGITPTEEGDNVVLYVDREGGIKGYAYFFCAFDFNPDGSFKEVGVYE